MYYHRKLIYVSICCVLTGVYRPSHVATGNPPMDGSKRVISPSHINGAMEGGNKIAKALQAIQELQGEGGSTSPFQTADMQQGNHHHSSSTSSMGGGNLSMRSSMMAMPTAAKNETSIDSILKAQMVDEHDVLIHDLKARLQSLSFCFRYELTFFCLTG